MLGLVAFVISGVAYRYGPYRVRVKPGFGKCIYGEIINCLDFFFGGKKIMSKKENKIKISAKKDASVPPGISNSPEEKPASNIEASENERITRIYEMIDQKIQENDGNADKVETWILENAKTVKDGYVAGSYLNSLIIRTRLDNWVNMLVYGPPYVEEQPEPLAESSESNPFEEPAGDFIPGHNVADDKHNAIKDFIEQNKTENVEAS